MAHRAIWRATERRSTAALRMRRTALTTCRHTIARPVIPKFDARGLSDFG